MGLVLGRLCGCDDRIVGRVHGGQARDRGTEALAAIADVEGRRKQAAVQAGNSSSRARTALEKDSDADDFLASTNDLHQSGERIEKARAEVRSPKAMPLLDATAEALRKSM